VAAKYFNFKQAQHFVRYTACKHKMTRYDRNFGSHSLLGPSWLRLGLQEKNEKEQYLVDVQSSTDKKFNARLSDTAELR